MSTFLNRVMMPTSTVGTGTLTISSAITNATLGDFFTLLEAGSMDGETVSYVLWEGHNVEMGEGVIGGTGTTMTRTVTASKIGGVAGTSKINLAGSGTMMLAPLAADLGGGGPAIEPETGSSPIKISAFPNAVTVMGTGDVVTGLQGGANANFSQAQLLSTPNAVPNTASNSLIFKTGNGNGTGNAGYIGFYTGNGGTDSKGGGIGFYGGYGTGNYQGGPVTLAAGSSKGTQAGADCSIYGGASAQSTGGLILMRAGDGVAGGNMTIQAGYATHGASNAGDVRLYIGQAIGSSTGSNGRLIIQHATSTPGAAAGTLTNAPAAGNPQFWLAVTINDTPYFIPAWHA